LFETLCDHAFDPGAVRDVSCVVPVGKGKIDTLYEAEGVPIHSRASLIGNVLEHMYTGNKKIEIGLVDLSDLRSADSPLEGQKNNPADVLINKSASAIRRAIHKVWMEDPELQKSIGKKNPEHTYEIGRYGGDEFIFALIGIYTNEQREKIILEIRETLAAEKGYYKKIELGAIPKEKGGGFRQIEVWEERPIGLKKGKEGDIVEWITLPEDSNEKRIFTEYFERGLLLNPGELQRIIAKYSPHGTFNEQLYLKDYPSESLYPQSITTIQQKVDYIQSQHPELAIYFDLARIYDHDAGTTLRQETVLKLIERSIFDPLLGDAVYSRFDFQEHFNRNSFSEVMVFDLKFIKEVNEGMSYADADAAIVKLWKNIKQSIKASDRGKIYISRFGGSFILGIKKGADKIDPETFIALQKLGSSNLDMFSHKTQSMEVPIGYSAFLKHDQTELNSIIETADDVFYLRLIDDIAFTEITTPGFMDSIVNTDLNELAQSKYHPLSKVEMYAKFLRGKRCIERTTRLLGLMSTRHGYSDMLRTMLPSNKHYNQTSVSEYSAKINKVKEFMEHINVSTLEKVK
ncbi:MAG: hypothetical protein NTV98_04105, partial [Candidatus Roizmanbacteria bacterium]|nr:hypothetical protein [Candidatus Roizmanbacteria bacterium]